MIEHDFKKGDKVIYDGCNCTITSIDDFWAGVWDGYSTHYAKIEHLKPYKNKDMKEFDLWIEESKKVGTRAYYELQAMQKKVRDGEARTERYINHIKDMSPELRAINIDKAVKKYSSDKYIDKEYRMGRYPSKDLLWLLYEYACEHCPEYDSDEMFVSEAYIIDGKYLLERADGQGSVIIVSKIEK